MSGDFTTAFTVASAMHHGQVRWFTDEPYFNHVARVAETVRRSQEYRDADGVKRRVLEVTAILHDVVEDTAYTIDQVRAVFGVLVADSLTRMTHLDGMPYIEYLKILKADPIARVVKRADMCDNMATLPWDRTKLWAKYAEGIAFLSS